MGEHCSLNNNNSQSEANPESGVTPILRNSPRASIFVSGLDAIIEDGERASLKAHIVGTSLKAQSSFERRPPRASVSSLIHGDQRHY